MKQVLEYVRKHQLITNGDRVVVGLSGGADSVCLLFVLFELQKEIDFQVYAVHINHHLRGQEAHRDALYVDKLCKKMQVPLEIADVQVSKLASELKIGTEEAGRAARYQVFEAYGEKVGATKIALAHHQNDLAETMIYHLARGTDLAGLAPIRPRRGKYIRPLLCMNRGQIEHYLKERGIEYVTDSSNLEDDYTRNKIRHHVVEYLEQEVNEQTAAHMSETAESLGELYDFLKEEASKKLVKYGRSFLKGQENIIRETQWMPDGQKMDGVFLADELQDEPGILTGYVVRLAIEVLAEGLKDITREHIRMVQELFGKEVGKEIHLPYGLVGKREYTGVFLGKELPVLEKEQDSAMEVPVPGHVHWNEYEILCEFDVKKPEEIREKPCTKWFDYDKMKRNLVLRYRKTGDYLVVNKDGGKKKLKDYFIDQKISKEQRDQIPLLCCGSEVLWAVGYRISEAYKITNETKNVLKVHILRRKRS